MKCRPGCGACCIVPSISTKTKLLPEGKPANTACIHLDEAFNCMIFNHPDRPKVCGSLKPSIEMCGNNREDAIAYLTWLDQETR
ncbi:YkgJ family cysteine cluster protein [Fusibacter bizertensis]